MAKVKLADLLVKRGLADSLKEAKALVMAGKVIVAERRVDKPGELVSDEVEVRVKVGSKYVSRAGDKLESAMDCFGLKNEFEKSICLDVGASTGGFTDCMLRHGASKVFTVDVGTNQLDWKLRNDERVISTEKTDVRKYSFPDSDNVSRVDWVVADVSFISLITLVDAFERLSFEGTRLLLMVKPKFELPKDLIPEGGIVVDTDLIEQSVERVAAEFSKKKFEVVSTAKSGVTGRFGNQEVFLYLKRT
ncbi:TlyA family RNA methyltransferase [bacterium]|nr:TlyA family RNA methyltransferase [bacterium]